MKAYLIFVGGTGARSMDALTYSLLAGCKPDNMPDYINVLSADSDMANKNLTNARDNMKMYKLFREEVCTQSPVKSDMASVDIEMLQWHTHPNGIAGGGFSLSNLTDGNAAAKRFADALYSDEEQRIDPDKYGYVAHPNLGTAVLQACMIRTPANSEYFRFFNNICVDLANNIDDVRLLIVGSLFGGTGASSFPALLSDIQRYVGKNPAAYANIGNLHIGAVMIAPYFHIKKSLDVRTDTVRITSDGFDTATKQALDYYAIHFSQRFNAVYLLGASPKHLVEEQAAGGADQEDPYMMLELDVAQSCLHYFSLPLAQLATDHMFYQYIDKNDGKLVSAWSDIGQGGAKAAPLARMLYFCFVTQLQLLEKFGDWKKHGGPEFYVKYAKNYMNTKEGEIFLRQLGDMTLKYLGWLKAMLHQSELDVQTVDLKIFDTLMAGVEPSDPENGKKCGAERKAALNTYAKLSSASKSPYRLLLNEDGDGIFSPLNQAELVRALNNMPEIKGATCDKEYFIGLIHRIYQLCCK